MDEELKSDEFLTVEEVSRLLRRSPRWLYSALARDPSEPGSVPHVRLPGRGGRRVPRFSRREIERWLSQGCPPAVELREGATR
jgi:hypothetical protein